MHVQVGWGHPGGTAAPSCWWGGWGQVYRPKQFNQCKQRVGFRNNSTGGWVGRLPSLCLGVVGKVVGVCHHTSQFVVGIVHLGGVG